MASSILRPLALTAALISSGLGAGCATTLQSVGIESVEGLSSRVERVQLELELSKQSVYRSVVSMTELFQREFQSDPVEFLEDFLSTTEACRQQAEKMRNQVAPMRTAADLVFANRQITVDHMNQESFRERAQRRLDEADARFRKVEDAAVSAQAELDAIADRLQDVVLFLGHDFNVAAVDEIREDALALRDDARGLSSVLDSCMDDCLIYLRETAIIGSDTTRFEFETTVQESVTEDQPFN